MTPLASITELRQRVFEFARAPEGWFALLGLAMLLALCYAVVWLYRGERRAGASARLRGVLAGLRCAVVLLLALVWLEPVIATYVYRALNGRVLAFIDTSASMSISDAESAATPVDGGPDATAGLGVASRFECARAQLTAADFAWLRALAARNDLHIFAFDGAAHPVALPWNMPWQDPSAPTSSAPAVLRVEQLAPTGAHTDYAAALSAGLAELGEGPLAGAIFLSDGVITAGGSVEELTALAQRARVPLYTVGVGQPDEPPNLRVTAVTAPPTVPPGDPFTVHVELAGSGVAEQDLDPELAILPATGGAETPAGRKHVRLDPAAGPATAVFEITPPVPGEYLVRARLPILEGEAVTDDNERAAPVLVLDERLRVLVVSGGPSFEYRHLVPLLERDKSIDVACWLQSAEPRAVRDGDLPLERLPRDPEELFAYDALLLLDPDPVELDSSWAVSVRRWIDELGGGAALQAGPHHTTRFLRDARLDELTAILPITPDPDADLRLQSEGTYRLAPAAFHLVQTAARHPLIAFDPDEAANRAIWAALPGVWWHLPVLRAKPVATVLLEHGGGAARNQYGPAVLLAAQPVGAGRTVFIGFSTTWRWRATGEELFNRFWVQLVRYLAHARRQSASNRGTLSLDRETFNVGDFVKLEARPLDPSFNPVHAAELPASLEWADGTRHEYELKPIPEREGWYAARLRLAYAGPAVFRVPLPGFAGTEAARAALTQRISVQTPAVEMSTLRMRADVLKSLAEQTGGAYVPLAEAGSLPERIPRATERKPPQRTGIRPLWDNVWVLGGVAALLALEWTLRRRNHLL